MQEIIVAVLYMAILICLLITGDRLGARLAGSIVWRTKRYPLLRLPAWLSFSISLLAPVAIIAGLVAGATRLPGCTSSHMVPGNIYEAVTAAFLMTGIVGGFIARGSRRQ